MVELEVSPYYLSKIQVGQEVVFESEALNDARSGRVDEIVGLDPRSTHDRPNSSAPRIVGLLVYATIEKMRNDDFKRIGATVEGDIITQTRDNSISIPLEAVVFDRADRVVRVIRNGKAKTKIVDIGESNRNEIEIISGLSEGDSVITIGNLDVADGDAVRVQ
jgi:membrane fusion protein (multidrug efflux system)